MLVGLQSDIPNLSGIAFLYEDIQAKVFVEQPPGFEAKDKDGGDLVMQLEKSLYGLAQCPGNWFHTIDPVSYTHLTLPTNREV